MTLERFSSMTTLKMKISPRSQKSRALKEREKFREDHQTSWKRENTAQRLIPKMPTRTTDPVPKLNPFLIQTLKIYRLHYANVMLFCKVTKLKQLNGLKKRNCSVTVCSKQTTVIY